jgi:hypothetical protein
VLLTPVSATVLCVIELFTEVFKFNRPWKPVRCEVLRVPHFLDRQLTDGSKVVSLTCWLPFAPSRIPGTYQPQGRHVAGKIRSLDKSEVLILLNYIILEGYNSFKIISSLQQLFLFYCSKCGIYM